MIEWQYYQESRGENKNKNKNFSMHAKDQVFLEGLAMNSGESGVQKVPVFLQTEEGVSF